MRRLKVTWGKQSLTGFRRWRGGWRGLLRKEALSSEPDRAEIVALILTLHGQSRLPRMQIREVVSEHITLPLQEALSRGWGSVMTACTAAFSLRSAAASSPRRGRWSGVGRWCRTTRGVGQLNGYQVLKGDVAWRSSRVSLSCSHAVGYNWLADQRQSRRLSGGKTKPSLIVAERTESLA